MGFVLVIGFIGYFNTTGDCTLQITITHRRVTVFTALLSSGFRRCSVLGFRVQRPLSALAGTFYLYSQAELTGFQLPKSESESYVTTDGQPASLSWNKAPIWGLRPDLYYMCDSCGLVLVGRPL
jgi:hypothetical protein